MDGMFGMEWRLEQGLGFEVEVEVEVEVGC